MRWQVPAGVLVVLGLQLSGVEGRGPVVRPHSDVASSTSGPLIDVEGAFAWVQVRGQHLTAPAGSLIPRPRYTVTIRNRFGFRNHFQGIQRVPARNYVVLSGSNPAARTAELFVVRLGADRAGRIAATLAVDTALWHAGGLGMWESILVIPVFGTVPLRAKLLFYYWSDPEHPRRLRVEIDRPRRKAYAAAITRLPNGRLLTAVFSDRDHLPRRLDLYLSRSDRIEDGFDSAGVTWPADEVAARRGQDRTFGDFQGISFIPQADGRLYLVGFHNTLPSLPIMAGRNYADLYEVVIPSSTVASSTPVLLKPQLIKVANRQFDCRDGYCNMDAAAGLDVDAATQSLHVYAAAGWLDDDAIRFTVYRGAGTPTAR
jgi:hypothetical protein